MIEPNPFLEESHSKTVWGEKFGADEWQRRRNAMFVLYHLPWMREIDEADDEEAWQKVWDRESQILREYLGAAIAEGDGQAFRDLGDLLDAIAEEPAAPEGETQEKRLQRLTYRCLWRFKAENGRTPAKGELMEAVEQESGVQLTASYFGRNVLKPLGLGWLKRSRPKSKLY